MEATSVSSHHSMNLSNYWCWIWVQCEHHSEH